MMIARFKINSIFKNVSTKNIFLFLNIYMIFLLYIFCALIIIIAFISVYNIEHNCLINILIESFTKHFNILISVNFYLYNIYYIYIKFIK